MNAPRRKPLRPAPKRPWIMPLIVGVAVAVIVVGLVYAGLHGFLFSRPDR